MLFGTPLQIEGGTYFEIPILAAGRTKNDDVISEAILDDIILSYDPANIHQAPVVDVDHDTKNAPALAWVDKVYKAVVNDRTWIIAKIKAASKEAAAYLEKMLAGPMKFNSPEIELYTPKGTENWADKSNKKWYLRRVNILGSLPPAQFGMPQAAYSDDLGEYKRFLLADGTMAGRMICPVCGRRYSAENTFCGKDGAELMSYPVEENKMQEKEKATSGSGAGTGTPSPSPSPAPATAQSGVVVGLSEADVKEAIRLALAERDKIAAKEKEDLEKRLAEERKGFLDFKRNAVIEKFSGQVEALKLAGKVNEYQKSLALQLAEQDALDDKTVIKLSDDRTGSRLDTIIEILANSPAALAEAGKSANVDATKPVAAKFDEKKFGDVTKRQNEILAANPKMSKNDALAQALSEAGIRDAGSKYTTVQGGA